MAKCKLVPGEDLATDDLVVEVWELDDKQKAKDAEYVALGTLLDMVGAWTPWRWFEMDRLFRDVSAQLEKAHLRIDQLEEALGGLTAHAVGTAIGAGATAATSAIVED